MKKIPKWQIDTLVANVNKVRLLIKAGGRAEDIQAWNNLGAVGIELGAPSGYGAQAGYNFSTDNNSKK